MNSRVTNKQNDSGTGTLLKRRVWTIGSALFFLVLCLVVLRVILKIFGPPAYTASPPPVYEYDSTFHQNALDWKQIAKEQDKILSFGSRLMGQTGVYETQDHITETYRQAGLEVHEQTNYTVVPKTQIREISFANGDLLPNVEIYPFLPNHLQPVTTPDEGITGRLVLMTDELIRNKQDFSNCIALIDSTEGQAPSNYLFDWAQYAQLGVKAVIVAHPNGMESIPWERVADRGKGMVSSIPANFVRLAANKKIFDYEGQEVTVRTRVRFEQVPNKTIIGVLRTGKSSQDNPNNEALVVITNYDAMSILPDLAPGGAQAMPVAVQLALCKGFSHYRDSMVRDVIFVAFGSQFMARDGDNNLLKLLDENILKEEESPVTDFFTVNSGSTEQAVEESSLEAQNTARVLIWKEREKENSTQYTTVMAGRDVCDNEGFLLDPVKTNNLLENLTLGNREFLKTQIEYVLDTIVFELNETVIQTKLAFLATGEESVESPEFLAYQTAKKRFDRAVTAAGFSPVNLLNDEHFGQGFIAEFSVLDRVIDRLDELKKFHEEQDLHLTQSLDVLNMFLPYSKLIVFDSKIAPAADDDTKREVLSFWDGDWGVKTNMREMSSLVASALQRASEHHPSVTDQKSFQAPELSRWHSSDVDRHTQPITNLSATEWTLFGYHMYTFLSFDRSKTYQHYFDPVVYPYMRDAESVQYSVSVLGEMLLSVAHGNGTFAPIQLGWLKKHFGGRVLASGLGQSMVPNYPVKGAVMGARPYFGYEYSYPGFYQHPLLMTDPYGRYEMYNTPSDFWVNNYIWAFGYSPIAVLHGEDGLITWMKDEGEVGQRLYKSVNLNWFDAKVDDITLVLFRASPVSLLDVTNPQKMTDYSGIRFFESSGMSGLEKYCHFRITPDNGRAVSFIEPDESIYLGLESGSRENDLAKVVRGFLLNLPAGWSEQVKEKKSSTEIIGSGYMGDEQTIIPDVPLQMARSMAAVNTGRLDLQIKYDMADKQVLDYHEKALEFLDSAEDKDQPHQQRVLDARDSVTYSMLNHPVLRRSLTEAVMGILYYLALLVPFVFFFEKMLFCYTDIRKQLTAQVAIFLVVFTLLRFLHPAFAMLRSSMMILLGFAIILIAGSMTLLFSEKFKENLEEFSKRRGQVKGAQINRLGVIGSAFMLGLNNMHRRKMRTILTCGTLTLMTFAMISFTSIQTDLVNEQVAMGKAPYQGILLKKENFERFSDAEVTAIQTKYGHKFEVCPRKMALGIQNWLDKQGYNPDLEVVFTRDENTRKRKFDSIVQLTHNDPLSNQLTLLAGSGWFTEEEQKGIEGELIPILLPDTLADELGVRLKDVDQGTVTIQINGHSFKVKGIFSSESLAKTRDLDSQDILPYDIESMSNIEVRQNFEVIASDSSPRLPAEGIIIAPWKTLGQDLGIQIPNAKEASNSSIALFMPEGKASQIKQEIDTFLEQSEKPAYYGLTGIAYRGQRTRKASVSGMIDLIVPLLIVALTVLNTMKGSVFERRGEISVYNAVGIAPRFVFFMFMAEALVYVVVGSLLGYLLSQGIGRILLELNMTGGLNMTFTSVTTIYASLAVAATVLASTWFPARTAMDIARPTEDAGWKLPEPEDDILTLDLPFSFNYRDRMAALEFCSRFLDDHGEGGSGSFYCLPPSFYISKHQDTEEYLPGIQTTVWLKPYDLGVSQRATITMTQDEDTGEYKALVTLQILSGSREAWMRLNYRFMAELRRHFLHWRAVSEEDRTTMFNAARIAYEGISTRTSS